MALWSSTSRPKTNTRGSNSISLATPSRRASTYRSSRCESDPLLLCIDVPIEFLRLREWTVLGKLDGFGDLLFDSFLDTDTVVGPELFSDCRNLIGSLPSSQFIAAAVTGVVIFVRSDVFAPAIGVALDETWAPTRSHLCDCIGRKLANF